MFLYNYDNQQFIMYDVVVYLIAMELEWLSQI